MTLLDKINLIGATVLVSMLCAFAVATLLLDWLAQAATARPEPELSEQA